MRSSLILTFVLISIIAGTLLSLMGWEIGFILFSLVIAIVLLIDLIILRKILIKASVKIKNTNMVTFHSVGLAVVGFLWMFIGIYKSNTQTDVANYSYNFFFGAIFIAYSIWYFFKYRYGCIITENYVYIAEDACFKKLKKEDVEISRPEGLLKVEVIKNKKTYVFLAKK